MPKKYRPPSGERTAMWRKNKLFSRSPAQVIAARSIDFYPV
jgi:hypothetical protein